jgi:succinyl-diaminopimelate desuccinylase
MAAASSDALPELDLTGDLTDLLVALVDIESVSGDERRVTDAIEAALQPLEHLELERDGDVLFARTQLGRAERVVLAGHTDTVPIAGNVPATVTGEGDERVVHGRGACDMKGGVAVQLAVAAALTEPSRDLTFIFYDHEEVEAELNGLARIGRERPDLLLGAAFAVLGEPSNARVEGGCQGTMRAEVTLSGVAAHSARSWMGRNAIHAAGPLLDRLAAHTPAQVEVDGLLYREGLNAVRIRGGIAGNVIPDRCVVEVNYRFAPDKDAAAAEAYVREVLDGFDLEITDVAVGARPGLDRAVAADFVAAVGGEAHPKFGWTDVARFSSLGVPAVNFGPGNPSKAHADDEFCPTADLHTCRDALLRWLG